MKYMRRIGQFVFSSFLGAGFDLRKFVCMEERVYTWLYVAELS